MFSIKMEGLEEFSRKLDTLANKAAALHGKHEIPFGELFCPAFMQEWTDFASLDEMFDASGFTVETSEDFAAIPDDEWEVFIAARTRFSSWLDMQKKATTVWAGQKLSF